MLAKKIALNTIVSAAARIIGTALALFSIGLMTRYLTKTEWGEYSIMLTFGGIFAVFAEFGLYQLMMREISRGSADESKIASRIFSLRLLIGLFIFALAPLASLLFPYSSRAQWGILAGMAGFWLMSGEQVLVGIFQKYLRMDKVALGELASRAVQLGLIVLFIKLNYGFFAIIGSFVLSALVNFLLVFWLAKRTVALRLSFEWPAARRLLMESYPLALVNILTMIYFSTDSLILSIFWPAADVGAYRLAYKVLENLIFFPAMFVGLIMPVFSQTAFGGRERFRDIFQRAFNVLAIFAAPLVAGILFVSPAIVQLLGGGNYPEAAVILNILIFAVGIIFFGTNLSFALIALEKQKSLLKIAAAAAIFNLVFNFLLIPRYSYYAAAAGTVLTELFAALAMFFVLRRALDFAPSFKIFGRAAAAAFFMAAFLWAFAGYNLFFLLGAAGALYFVVLYALKGFSLNEVLFLLKR